MKRVLLTTLLLALAGAVGFCVYMETRASTYTIVDAGLTEAAILAERPDIAISEADRAMEAALLADPEVTAARAESLETGETVDLIGRAPLLEPWLTEPYTEVSEFAFSLRGILYVGFVGDSQRIIYGFSSEGNLIHKVIGCYDRNHDPTAIYENNQGALTKHIRKRLWFQWVDEVF